MSDEITTTRLNPEHLSEVIRTSLCRHLYGGADPTTGVQHLQLCLKPLPCEDHDQEDDEGDDSWLIKQYQDHADAFLKGTQP